jgi:hypothetical protein
MLICAYVQTKVCTGSHFDTQQVKHAVVKPRKSTEINRGRKSLELVLRVTRSVRDAEKTKNGFANDKDLTAIERIQRKRHSQKVCRRQCVAVGSYSSMLPPSGRTALENR